MNIQQLNDNFRWNLFDEILGVLHCTSAVAALPNSDFFALLEEVRFFEDFTPDNDPYGEHDFGAIDFKSNRYFWKIDYYPNHRTLTIMHADEY